MVKGEREKTDSQKKERPLSPEEKIALLRNALLRVESVLTYVNEDNIDFMCPWCGRDEPRHEDDCQRQVALEKTKPTTP